MAETPNWAWGLGLRVLGLKWAKLGLEAHGVEEGALCSSACMVEMSGGVDAELSSEADIHAVIRS